MNIDKLLGVQGKLLKLEYEIVLNLKELEKTLQNLRIEWIKNPECTEMLIILAEYAQGRLTKLRSSRITDETFDRYANHTQVIFKEYNWSILEWLLWKNI